MRSFVLQMFCYHESQSSITSVVIFIGLVTAVNQLFLHENFSCDVVCVPLRLLTGNRVASLSLSLSLLFFLVLLLLSSLYVVVIFA